MHARTAWAFMLLTGFGGTAWGTTTVFTIDPANSEVALSGAVNLGIGSLPIQEQALGSLITQYSGTITTDLGAGLITIQSANAVAEISGDWLPDSSSANVAAPANYGGRIDAGAFGSVNFAVRNLTANLSSGALPIVGDSFAANTLDAEVMTGVVDYQGTLLATPVADEVILDGASATNDGANGSLTIDGGNYVLTIPMDVSLLFTDILNDPSGTDDLSIRLLGTLTATAPVPEPGGVLLFAAGAGWLVRRRRR